jgi:hypothetical protein
MTDHDPFEDRLRETLRSGDPAVDRPDVDGFLMDVHSGARSRRRRRTAGIAAAAALVVVGGGAVVAAPGLLNDDRTQAADGPSTGATTSTETGPTSTTQSTEPVTSAPPTVSYTAGNTHVLSLTSTGNDHQWVLTKTDSDACSTNLCASVFKTDAQGSWSSLGLFPYPLDSSAAQDANVSELRFAATGGGYDGWAFGPGLVSVHGVTDDTGTLDWHKVNQNVYGGYVTSLEAHGSTVYMIAETGEAAETLFMSPVSRDDWQQVPGGDFAGGAVDLNVSAGVVALRTYHNDVWDITSSPANPLTGEADNAWQTTQPCATGGVEDLSSASNVLWALCANGAVATATVRDSGPPAWTTVVSEGTFAHGPRAQIAARDTGTALVAQNSGVSAIQTDNSVVPLTGDDFHQATLFGFTNDRLGFAVVDGRLLRTTDGGTTWSEEQVVPGA